MYLLEKDGRPKGSGFVQLSTKEGLIAALALDDTVRSWPCAFLTHLRVFQSATDLHLTCVHPTPHSSSIIHPLLSYARDCEVWSLLLGPCCAPSVSTLGFDQVVFGNDRKITVDIANAQAKRDDGHHGGEEPPMLRAHVPTVVKKMGVDCFRVQHVHCTM